ncbi:MAG: NADH-quinone oxidoreductase subunit M [Flavobacteriales bacterium]|nr:NADH-quinone oxidoreductase subunit M [Flavobacteriales bacterium]
MELLALILIPFLAATALLAFRPAAAAARGLALTSTLLTLAFALWLWYTWTGVAVTGISHDWVPAWGMRFKLGYSGIGLLMILLTGVLFPFIIGTGYKQPTGDPALVNSMLLFSQAALFGVFMAQNAFLFYIFFELSLIPIFFLLLFWGGEHKRAITIRFFLYTLLGGLALLFSIAYVTLQTPLPHSADFSALAALELPMSTQYWLFWTMFLAFAIKMPIFPFHSWQPETYVMAPTQGTMVLSAVMGKMGIYGVVLFLFTIVPEGALHWTNLVLVISLFGALYAAVIAFRQDDFKRLVAYSSMSHMGLMCAALFTWNAYGISGGLYQTFAHGVLMVCLFYIVGMMYQRVGTNDLSAMGGLKTRMPRMALLFMLVVGNAISMPLTQSFVGEWLMFNGLWQLDHWMAVAGVVLIVLGAIYMLYAYQRVLLGPDRQLEVADADDEEHFFLVPLIAITFVVGVFPNIVLHLVDGPVQQLLNSFTSLP